MKLLVTGGAGFIGSAFIRHVHRNSDATVINVDALTYAANPAALEEVAQSPRYRFEKADIADARAMTAIIGSHQPDAIVNIAAETHHPDQHCRHVDPAGRRTPLLERASDRAPRRVPLPPRLDRRGVRLADVR
jgi:dTDP-D-glucose 4,6-dehydratase